MRSWAVCHSHWFRSTHMDLHHAHRPAPPSPTARPCVAAGTSAMAALLRSVPRAPGASMATQTCPLAAAPSPLAPALALTGSASTAGMWGGLVGGQVGGRVARQATPHVMMD